MNPQNGEIMAMVNLPEFNLNEPYTLLTGETGLTAQEQQEALNKMWRNKAINDSYDLCMMVLASPGRSIPVFVSSPNCSK